MAFLGSRLGRPAEAPAHRLQQLLADLDHEDFETREKATEALRTLGLPADAALRRALLVLALSPEVKGRVREILAALEAPYRALGETLRRIRAVQVLERIGSDGAKEISNNPRKAVDRSTTNFSHW